MNDCLGLNRRTCRCCGCPLPYGDELDLCEPCQDEDWWGEHDIDHYVDEDGG